MTQTTPVSKDEEFEQPVPSVWRRTLAEIVEGLKLGDYTLGGIEDVVPLVQTKADLIASIVADYGCTLISLPSDAWNTSVCSWQLEHWEVLVDLFTVEEGRSDLVLHLNVFEALGRFRFEVHLVYVP